MARKSDVELVHGIGSTPVGLIHLVVFLEAAINSELLRAAYIKSIKGSRDKTPYAKALFDGYWTLRNKAREQAFDLTRRGQLLFAFPGTTVLQGGAA